MKSRNTLAISLALGLTWASVQAEEISIVSWNVESGGAQPANLAQRIKDFDGYELWGLSEVKNTYWIQQFAQSAEDGEDANFRYLLGTTGKQ